MVTSRYRCVHDRQSILRWLSRADIACAMAISLLSCAFPLLSRIFDKKLNEFAQLPEIKCPRRSWVSFCDGAVLPWRQHSSGASLYTTIPEFSIITSTMIFTQLLHITYQEESLYIIKPIDTWPRCNPTLVPASVTKSPITSTSRLPTMPARPSAIAAAARLAR